MKLASEPIGLIRAATVILARTEMKYGSNVFEIGEWWWELDERARPEYEWAKRLISVIVDGTEVRPGASYPSMLGIKVVFIDAKTPADVGHISLHTDRTDLTRDDRLHR